jgi:hypothetical protein
MRRLLLEISDFSHRFCSYPVGSGPAGDLPREAVCPRGRGGGPLAPHRHRPLLQVGETETEPSSDPRIVKEACQEIRIPVIEDCGTSNRLIRGEEWGVFDPEMRSARYMGASPGVACLVWHGLHLDEGGLTWGVSYRVWRGPDPACLMPCVATTGS